MKDSIIQRGRTINEAALLEEVINVEEERQETDTKRGKGKGKGRAGDIQPAIQWVQSVLDLKDKINLIWKNSFQSSRDVESCINDVSSLKLKM